MSEFRTLTPQLAVSSQLDAEGVRQAARAGYRTIINNRPDHEDAAQPPNDELARLARELGLDWHHQPVQSGNVTDADAERFGRTLAEVEGPVLAFCRTGTRCTMLWALSHADRQAPEELLGTARNAGYDLTGLRPRLEARAGNATQ